VAAEVPCGGGVGSGAVVVSGGGRRTARSPGVAEPWLFLFGVDGDIENHMPELTSFSTRIVADLLRQAARAKLYELPTTRVMAATALGLLCRDEDIMEKLLHSEVCSVFTVALKEPPMHVQAMVADAMKERRCSPCSSAMEERR
jgi:hypothetical protein